MSYRSLNKAPHPRYLTEFWIWFTNQTEGKIFVYSEMYSITNNSKKRNSTGFPKLQAPKIKHGYQIKKKVQLFQKFM